MARSIVLLVLGLCLLSPLAAQKKISWKKQLKLADEAYEKGDYEEAAQNYYEAWIAKENKKELVFNAAENFYKVRNYRKAAECYSNVADDNTTYPLAGLKYARSLKQDGRYDKAIKEFQAFFEGYSSEGREILEDIIQTEIRGCELGKDLSRKVNRDIEVVHVGKGVNSDDTEFAPIPFEKDVLYFSSDMGGNARIYRSDIKNNNYSKGTQPENFPIIKSQHFANGTLTPDNKRFYFTICDGNKSWNALNTRCEIFVIKRLGDAWSQPERLPDYINMRGKTATHPNVVFQGDKEVIFYSSNREGTRGEMDIWYVTRDRNSEDLDFTFPVNVGPAINTIGNEITPFYIPEERTMYFASNGHISIGGFDIFRSEGGEATWSLPNNAGTPINSSADDAYYILDRDKSGGYFVSNRNAGQKTSTTHDDIFAFTSSAHRLTLEGSVYDKNSGELLKDITVFIYNIANGEENLTMERAFPGGRYELALQPEMRYKVEVISSGYETAYYQFATNDPNTTIYGQPLFLDRRSDQPFGEETTSDSGFSESGRDFSSDNDGGDFRDDPPVNLSPGNDGPLPLLPGTTAGDDITYTSRGKSANDNYEISTNAPRYQGTYFKIQLIALGKFNPQSSKFRSIRNMGRLDTELILDKGLTRVLLADFFSMQDAFDALSQVKSAGFDRAFVVKYENGERYGKVKR